MDIRSDTGAVDNRRFIRIGYDQPIRLLLAPATVSVCKALDISEGGVAVVLDAPLPTGTACMLSFDHEGYSSVRRINSWGRVVYSAGGGQVVRVGIEFLDMDSYSRLLVRRISRPRDEA